MRENLSFLFFFYSLWNPDRLPHTNKYIPIGTTYGNPTDTTVKCSKMLVIDQLISGCKILEQGRMVKSSFHTLVAV